MCARIYRTLSFICVVGCQGVIGLGLIQLEGLVLDSPGFVVLRLRLKSFLFTESFLVLKIKDTWLIFISANNGNKRLNLMRYKILYYRSLPSVTLINISQIGFYSA